MFPKAPEICGDGIDQDCSSADEPCPIEHPLDVTVAVDSTYSGYTTAAVDDGVVDAYGGKSTTWASDASAIDPHWVTFDFITPRELSFVSIHWAFNDFRQELMTSQRVDVQYFDGDEFVTLGTLNNSDGPQAMSRLDFDPIETSQLRLWQPANMGSLQYSTVMWLTEVDYGAADPVVEPACDPLHENCQPNLACPEHHVVINSDDALADQITVVVQDAQGNLVTCARIDTDLRAVGCDNVGVRTPLGLMLLVGLFSGRRRLVHRILNR
ncbi:MAG: discoidin domain-containing protein [Myxococcota bacterium]